MVEIKSYSKLKSNNGTDSASGIGGGSGYINTTIATKLKQIHSLWGNQFDGTQDVLGPISAPSVDVSNNLSVHGNSVFDGPATFGNQTKFKKDVSINGTLDVSAGATFGNQTKFKKDVSINGTLDVSAGASFGGQTKFKKDVSINGTLDVSSDANFNSQSTFKGTATFNSNANTTNVLPLKNKEYNLGDDNHQWKNIVSENLLVNNLKVTGQAHFFNLIIDKIKSAGGAALFTPADGFEVEKIKSMTNNITLYWRCQDGNGNQRDNMWKVNDQALCMSFNKAKVGTTHNVSNKYYWALVTGTNPVDEPTVIDGVKYNYITLSKTIVDGVLNPEFGDSIVMCGYRGTDDAARQSAIYISAYSSLDEGLTAPLLAQYQGINDFNLESHRTSYYDAVGAKFVGDFEVEGKNVIDYINDKVEEKYSSLSVTVDGINTKVVNNTSEITKLGNNLDITNNNITALETTVSNNYSTLDQKADGIKATVSANTKSITTVNKKVDDNKAATDTAIANTNNTITALTQTVKNNYSTLDQKADGIKTTVSANTETITAQGTSISNLESGLTSTNSTITALTKTVKDNYSTLDHKADNISSTVSSHTQIIEGLDGRVTTNTENISKVKQTASSITSTVSSMKDDILGANCMLGLNGQGWSSNTIYEDAGNSFHCESTDWFQSHPIMDFSGDYTFSFGLWNDNLQIKILDFTQTYYDDGIYDQYVDFGPYTPCKILTTPATLPNAALTNYATSGTSSNWTYTNTETITLKVGDNVAVRVTNGDNKRYNSIYGTVSAINTSSKSVTVRAIALLDQPNTICTLTCPKDKKDGTAINSLHYDEKLGRYWIRFKESRGTTKTFVMLFRNLSTSTIGWISRLMLEESVEYPHKYNNTGQASQSMIKQTANEILMSVNDTYLKIGDGNITLNGDTKVNGSLTLNDEKQGFLLVGNGGITEISPNSIGTYNEFASKTINVIKTNYDSKIYGYKAEDGDYYRFSWTVLQRLGTFKKGTYIKILNYTNSAYAIGATSHISTPYGKFYIYENGTTTKTIDIGNKTSVNIANYTVVGDNVDVIVDGHFTIGVPTSIWGANGNPHPAIEVSTNWNNEVPKTSSTFMLIGYDGWGANFGTNTTVYCGKDGFIASYGNNEFRITDAGISHNNMATTYTIIGTSSSSSPTTYTVQDPIDTVLCKSGYCKVIFPSNPYNGQRIKIYDKSPQESYINSNGKYVCSADRRYSDRSIWTNQNLANMAVRIYTYINDTWYEEYTG